MRSFWARWSTTGRCSSRRGSPKPRSAGLKRMFCFSWSTLRPSRSGATESGSISWCPEQALAARGVAVFEVDRGGDITYHGPGQLVGYPILELRARERDVHRYMRNLEELVLRLLNSYGIRGARHDHFTGVWTDAGKIAAMGVHISRWITRHGFALNVSTDLSFFDLIVPCGISGAGIASMASILGRAVKVEEVASRLVPFFGAVFDRTMTLISEADLYRRINDHAQQSAVA